MAVKLNEVLISVDLLNFNHHPQSHVAEHGTVSVNTSGDMTSEVNEEGDLKACVNITNQ